MNRALGFVVERRKDWPAAGDEGLHEVGRDPADAGLVLHAAEPTDQGGTLAIMDE